MARRRMLELSELLDSSLTAGVIVAATTVASSLFFGRKGILIGAAVGVVLSYVSSSSTD